MSDWVLNNNRMSAYFAHATFTQDLEHFQIVQWKIGYLISTILRTMDVEKIFIIEILILLLLLLLFGVK